jgi:hypothetical protein
VAKVKTKPEAKPVAKAVKAPKSTKVTRPAMLVAQPPPPPPLREELDAPRDIGRLIRYGERFGANKIDVRMLPAQLPINGAFAMFDPADKKSWKVLDRPAGSGLFRIMASIVKPVNAIDASKDKLAAIVIHTGRPPIARWTVAHWKGQKKPKSADDLPRVPSSGWIALMDASGGSPGVLGVPTTSDALASIEVPLTDGRRALAIPSGKGEFVAYWAIDAQDKPICLVIDFDAITAKDWKAKPT